jgi:hypothetical protein
LILVMTAARQPIQGLDRSVCASPKRVSAQVHGDVKVQDIYND